MRRTKTDQALIDKFYWELEFEDGTRVKQGSVKMNPERPPSEYGRPIFLRLKSSFPTATASIPPGASPVYHRLHDNDYDISGEVVRRNALLYRIGWSVGSLRVMTSVNSQNGTTDLVVDRLGKGN